MGISHHTKADPADQSHEQNGQIARNHQTHEDPYRSGHLDTQQEESETGMQEE